MRTRTTRPPPGQLLPTCSSAFWPKLSAAAVPPPLDRAERSGSPPSPADLTRRRALGPRSPARDRRCRPASAPAPCRRCSNHRSAPLLPGRAPLLRLVQHQAAGLRRVRQRLAVLGKPSPPAPPPPLPHCFRRQNRHPLLLSRPLPPTPLPPSTPRVRRTVGPMRAEPCGQPASPPVAPPERRLAGGSPRPAAGPQLAPARRVT